MSKVYVAIEGSYNDYRIIAVFSSREAAELVSDDVQEFEVFDTVPAKATAWVIEASPFDAPERESQWVDHPWWPGWVTYSHGETRVDVWEYDDPRAVAMSPVKAKAIRVSGADRDKVREAFEAQRKRLAGG